MPKPKIKALLIGLLAVVVVAVLAKIVVTDQPWPDSRALGRGLFVVLVSGAVPLAAWLIRRRR
jgi:hypothetical protein